MLIFLITIIYLAFVSLGLPDSMLGAAWATLSAEIGAPISAAGIITMVIACFTILSSLMSNFLTTKLGTGPVTACSVLLTAVALFGFSFCTALWQLCLWAIPYGLGAGAIDAALNNYVALYLSSRHMNWLHACWGVGASVSPYIMGFCLSGGLGWQNGYRIVGGIQLLLTIVMFATLPLWKKQKPLYSDAPKQVIVKTKDALKTRGVWLVFVMFFAYCALEQTAMLWASSYLVLHRNVTKQLAATFATLFCTGMTAGRFLCGFVSAKLSDKALIRLGSAVVVTGIVTIALPFETNIPALAGFVVIGLGCAPIYPAIIHSTPTNFGKEKSQAIVGIQMAFAYTATTFVPPLFGTVVEKGAWALPLFLGIFAAVMIVLSEILNKVVSNTQTEETK